MIGGAPRRAERGASTFQRKACLAGGFKTDGVHGQQQRRGGDLLAVGFFKTQPIDKGAARSPALRADQDCAARRFKASRTVGGRRRIARTARPQRAGARPRSARRTMASRIALAICADKSALEVGINFHLSDI